MVLVEQINALIDFLESRKELALGHLGRSNEGRCLAKRQWSECADILNSLTAGCPQKSPMEWRTFYNDYKCKLIKKIKHNKRDISATGGGKGKPLKLTPLQERLYNILGRDLGEPLPGVRLDPLTQNSTLPVTQMHSIVDGPSTSSLHSNLILCTQENPIDPPIEPSIELIIEPSTEAPTGTSVELITEPVIEDLNLPPMEPIMPSIESPSGPHIEPSVGESRTTPNRRIRSRPLRRSVIDRQRSNLESAQERLERLESKKAEATLEHARATNRLAAALERVADRLDEPIKIQKIMEELD